MAGVPVTTRVYWRDDIGRFASAVKAGAAAAIQEASREGARLSAEFAPKKRGTLAGSIRPIGGGQSGGWATGELPEALPQEKGAAGHVIGADGQFLANKAEGFAAKGPVWHPGNPAVHYMRRAFSFIWSARVIPLIRKNMP